MKSKRLCVLSATAILLLSLGSAARADDACASLKDALSAYHAIPEWLDANGIRAKLLACRSQLYGQASVHSDTQASATGGTFTTFDIPGAGSGGPIPTAINAAGAITGYYWGANGGPYGVTHSFLRAPDGTITTFDPPGTCEVSTGNTCGSGAASINPAGVIVGSYDDDNGTYHGYLRRPNGTFTTIDVPGFSGIDSPSGINPAGTVTGSYFETGSGAHGFVRSANGVFTTFDPPDSSYTQADAINPGGAIAGSYEGVGGSFRGFLRSPDGNIVTFASPVGGSVYDYPHFTINAEGAITGTYCGSSCHGFLRARDGSFTTIDAPGNNYGTFPAGIDSAGAITGFNLLADFSAQHGFLRTRQGTFITLDPPGSVITTPTAINERGAITGMGCDATGLICHGFVWTPNP